MNNSSASNHVTSHRSDRQLIYGLTCLLLALLSLTIGVFTGNPVGISGIASLALGLLFACTMIFFFFRYAHFTKQEEKTQNK
jgi:lipopolysaccharide export LptBFGC system permease protein LptF